MIKKLFSFLAISFSVSFFNSARAQIFTLYGDRSYGGNLGEATFTSPIIKTGNNQFIIGGSSYTNINGDKTQPICADTTSMDEWLLKIDSNFNIIWDKDFGGAEIEYASSLLMTANNKIIFGCESNSDSACQKTEHNRTSFPGSNWDYWLGMLDSNGNKLWDKTLGGTNADRHPQIIQLNSGNIIVGGASLSPVSGDKTVLNYGQSDYWVVKLDSNGNKLWDKVYGGTLNEASTNSIYFGTVFSIFKDDGENFILAGSTKSPLGGSISDTSKGATDIWLIKLDSAGNKIWDKRYGGSGNDYCAHIIRSSDNGYMILGTTDSPQGLDVSDSSRGLLDFWIIKTDSVGNKQWDKRYGGNKDDDATWIEPAPRGGYWLSGYTYSDGTGEVSEANYGSGVVNESDYWIIKIDSAGNKLWDKRFGQEGLDLNSNFIIMGDSSIVMFGYADSGISVVKTDPGKGSWDYWLVHFKYDDYSTGIKENTNENNLISIYPNPTKGKFILNSNTNSKAKAAIYIYDVMGKEVYCKKDVLLNHHEIDMGNFNKGVYFLKAKTGGNVFTKKIIKI